MKRNYTCSICGRKLTNAKSIARCIGPVCYRKLMLKSRSQESAGSCGGTQQTITWYMKK